MHCIGFPPSIDSSCRILILGSMPGVRSLEEQQYYAHPQNRFWPLMARLLGEREAPTAYEDRLRMLLRRHIALWDSIGTCERDGSLDSAIKKSRAMISLLCSGIIPESIRFALTAQNPLRRSGAITGRCCPGRIFRSMLCRPPVRPMPAGAWTCWPRPGERSSRRTKPADKPIRESRGSFLQRPLRKKRQPEPVI